MSEVSLRQLFDVSTSSHQALAAGESGSPRVANAAAASLKESAAAL